MEQKKLIKDMNKYWRKNNIFKKSIEERSEKFQSLTYDGPPFASGTPHFGHGITSSMKDAILRYKTMKGYRVNRDRGRDCHGLPVEKAVEKALGLDGKRDIEEKLGVEKFVEECRNYVSNTSDEWRTFVDYLGRWADMDNAYFTMNLDFMESVLRTFQNMYNKNLVYKGFKVQWFCPSCATALSNSEVNEGYQDRQDPAITVKFPVYQKADNKHETTPDGFTQVVFGIIKKDEKFLLLYHKKGQKYVFPGGKMDKGTSREKTVQKEVKEEIGCEVTKSTFLGSFKDIMPYGLYNLNIVETEISGEPQNLEPEKHSHMVRAEVIDSDNALGFAIKIDETVIDNDDEIMNQFHSLYVYHKNLAKEIQDIQFGQNSAVNVLAWTTTPWTLPSNMFLAVGKHIKYVMVFDPSAKEYYIIAENLLKQYYRDPSEYILINIFQGEYLENHNYEPLFPYINQSKIEDIYKKEFFKIIIADFVSTEDGTGIVHIAPSFGEDDFNVVAEFLPREKAKERLFLPVNDFGEFSEEVPEWTGIRVYEANKEIIQKLKDEKKLIGQRSYNHSYPHCRRCDTALISKALTSRFIKEQELAKTTVPNAEKIGFVPETVKNRFRDTLKSAPDRNLGRKRYRGSPIPIWVNDEDENDRIVIGTLDELYNFSKTGSKNLTKHLFVRHGHTDYNGKGLGDPIGKAILDKTGKKQAELLSKNLKNELKKDKDLIVIISPLHRTLETVTPYLKTILNKVNSEGRENALGYKKQYEELVKKYNNIKKEFKKLIKEGKILNYIKDTKTQKRFELLKNIFVDFRITDTIIPDYQDKPVGIGKTIITTLERNNKPITPAGESMLDIFDRIKDYMKDINDKFKTKTILTVSHEEPVTVFKKIFKDFDWNTQKEKYLAHNTEIATHYRDNDRNTEVDLHKPYIDNYRFSKKGKKYHRVDEVMDCRFESGAMPFGQVGYIGKDDSKLIYPADFIIEGLDQTRGRFRGMHVIGNAVMQKNPYNNVIINGMILAEDGKKMSKKLNNYPDPEYLFNRYGPDAYRLYMLSSPGVRAEPVRFSEKGVDQVYKDFTSAALSSYKFFETYAKVDKFSYNKPTVYFIRHGESTLKGKDPELTDKALKAMRTPDFISKILRTDPDIIYASTFKRATQTAQTIQAIIKKYRNRDVKIITTEALAIGKNTTKMYQEILDKESGKKVLLVSHVPQFEDIWHAYYDSKEKIKKLEIIKLPTYNITNELDKRILAELNQLGIELETAMDKYFLDTGAKAILGFIDKLNNRYIRRSRRRFWASGMDQDKVSAYTTLFEVLETYMKLCAPFAPFIAEHIYLELQKFKLETRHSSLLTPSVHLEHLPISSEHYINKELLSETQVVRKIISLGLFIRSKNKIAVKQPLQKMEIKID